MTTGSDRRARRYRHARRRGRIRVGSWTPARGTAFTALALLVSANGTGPSQTAATARVENVEAGARTVVAQGTGPAIRFAPTERPPKPQLSLLPLVVPAPAEPAPEPPTVAAAPVAPAEPAVTVPPEPAPAPNPPPEPEPVSSPVSSGSVENAIAAWFPDLYDEAYEVAVCESTLNPGAVSPGGGNHGLFQINTVHRGAFEAVTGVEFYSGVYDPYLNAQFARHLHDESGWAPWACSP